MLTASWAATAQDRLQTRTDTVRQTRTAVVQWAVPALCVTYGLAARFNQWPVRRLDKHVQSETTEHIHRRYRADDYLQYLPGVAAYTLDFAPGVQSRYNLRDRTLLFATAYLLTGAVTLTMKEHISVWRPDGSRDNSFPSGHTAMAFTGAHLLYKAYRDESPWIAVGGYAAAVATGALRVVNNRNWVSDVAMGAGVAILSVEAACLLLPVWHRVLGIQTDDARLAVLPAAVAGGAGVGLVYVF